MLIIKRLIKRLTRHLHKRRKEYRLQDCGCCPCPNCGENLNAQPAIFKLDKRGVMFTCTECGKASYWLYEPTPEATPDMPQGD